MPHALTDAQMIAGKHSACTPGRRSDQRMATIERGLPPGERKAAARNFLPLTSSGKRRFIRNSTVSHSKVNVRKALCFSLQSDRPEAAALQHTEDFLDRIRWDAAGLVTVIAQDIDSGEVLMQAFSDRNGIHETLSTKLATFYSRSRKARWCKGETSGNYIHVKGVYLDCDRDSVVYLGEPDGPSCHTGARTCWFSEASAARHDSGAVEMSEGSPLPSLLALEQTIQRRRDDSAQHADIKPSWTAKLLRDPALLCSKVREEADELCETLERSEDRGRTASEMADLLYHSMVLLNAQGVSMRDVCKVLRARFGQSGVEEKAARPATPAAGVQKG